MSGALLLAAGGWRAAAENRPKATVREFLTALKAGHRDAALELLAEDQQAIARESLRGEPAWQPMSGFHFQISDVRVADDFALAHVWISEGGYRMCPEFSLRRGEDGHWQITEISRLFPDPRWEAAERRRRASDNDALARELTQALQNSATVLVERQAADRVRR